jgi:predicted RNase H-like nuclease (RuvC/YqgF family)
VSIKNCEECTKSFKPSRRTQRFCSIPCGNRQRDRRRRTGNRPATERSADAITTDLRIELEGVKRQLETKTKAGKRQMEILQSKLRSQASEIDRLEAENSELRSGNNLLQSEVTRLKRAQRTNVQDLAHIAAWLVSMAQAKGVALDGTTLEILRRRGWNPSKRQAGAARL